MAKRLGSVKDTPKLDKDLWLERVLRCRISLNLSGWLAVEGRLGGKVRLKSGYLVGLGTQAVRR